MAARVEIELDIFSGMPNPAWVLTHTETDSFVKQLAALPQATATELSGKLGYRGFIAHVTHGTNKQMIRIHNGTVHVSEGARDVYGYDQDRDLERWLLNTGKPHLKSELVETAERDLR